jgi:hypothetical protein
MNQAYGVDKLYYIESYGVEKLKQIANRLGDTQVITTDQRRDLMNKLVLVISDIQEVKEKS